ncbi:MAG: mandelate racemase/muconate lactonizing enzyme family protein [Thermoproteus sp. AZ2]|uniref:Mandelate racemase/muconate lactonizing enzyme family protein n=1 Tax=Thermoproteus sp. AZ2 TaxID=1609232 RepID=A0ACC6V380_9CREN
MCGVGEAFMNTSKHQPYLALAEEMGERIKGLETWQIEKAGATLEHAYYAVGRGGLTSIIASAIDVALHDLRAKELGVPLHQLLGGAVRERVKAYASLARYKACGDVVKVVEHSLARGFKAVKIHQHGVDVLECAEVVRRELGYGFELMADLNASLSPGEAMRILPKLAKYELAWVEEPIWPPEDYKALGELSKRAEVPIAAGENEYTLYGFAKLIEEGGVLIIQPDIAKVGGLTKIKKIAALAEALGAVVVPHSRPHSLWINIMAAVHFVSTLSYESMVEVSPTPPRQEPFVKEVEISGGEIAVPNAPGIGVRDSGWTELFPPKEGEVVDYHKRYTNTL